MQLRVGYNAAVRSKVLLQDLQALHFINLADSPQQNCQAVLCWWPMQVW